MTEKQKTRFLSKFKQGTPDECWEWESLKINSGYGKFSVNEKYFLTHRLSYELFKGEIPEGLCVLHTCDNRLCVNPNHLWLGTKRDNKLDCQKKGRCPAHHKFTKRSSWWLNHPNQGEKHPESKLREKEVREIRSSNLKQKELAKIYKVTKTTISQIKLRKTWKHLEH